MVRFIGVSNFDAEELNAAELALRDERMPYDQVLYHLAYRGIERHLLPYCSERKIAVVGFLQFKSYICSICTFNPFKVFTLSQNGINCEHIFAKEYECQLVLGIDYTRTVFFIRYLKQKDNHYVKDLIPVLNRWCNEDTNLQFYVTIRAQSFHNMFLNMIHNMHFFDRNYVARDHLYTYHYTDNRSFDLLQKNVGIYNNMVGSFINGFTDDIEIFLKTELPNIKQYRREDDPQTNFYHYSSILYYFWLVYWQSRDKRHETQLEIVQYGNSHHLRISPSGEPIASANNRNDIIKLQSFVASKTPDVIFRLTRLNEYRNEAIELYIEFRNNIERLLEKQTWTRPIRGRCRWEQQYFSIRDKE